MRGLEIYFFNSLNFFLFPFEFQYLVSGRGDLHTWRYQKRLRKICLNFSDFFFLFCLGQAKILHKKISKIKIFSPLFSFLLFFSYELPPHIHFRSSTLTSLEEFISDAFVIKLLCFAKKYTKVDHDRVTLLTFWTQRENFKFFLRENFFLLRGSKINFWMFSELCHSRKLKKN